jgi:hypothetical protein
VWEIIDVWSIDGELKIAGETPNQNFFRVGFVPSVLNSRFYPGLGMEYDF